MGALLSGVPAFSGSPVPNDKANGVIQGSLNRVGPTKAFPFRGPFNLSIWGEYTSDLDTTAGSSTGTVGTIGAVAAGQGIKCASLPPGSVVTGVAGSNITIALPIYTYSCLPTVGQAKLSQVPDTRWLLGSLVTGLGLAGVAVTAIPTPSVDRQPNVKNIRGEITLASAPTVNPQSNQVLPYEFALDNDAIVSGTNVAAIFTGEAIGLTGMVQLERSFDGGDTWIPMSITPAGAALAEWSLAAPVSTYFGEPEVEVMYRLNVVTLTPSAGTDIKFRLSTTGQAATTLQVPTV